MTRLVVLTLVGSLVVGCGGGDFTALGFDRPVDQVDDAGDARHELDAGDARHELDAGDARHELDAGAGGTGGASSTVVSAGGLRSSGGTSATGGSSSSGGTSATGGSSSSGGTSATCPANPRTDCPNYCGDVTSRCCSAGRCGCLTDTTQGRVCL